MMHLIHQLLMILQLSYYHPTQFLSHLKENIDLKQRYCSIEFLE